MPRLLVVLALAACLVPAGTVRFAEDGALKMLYDSRMFPQAVESGGSLYIVWRGSGGLPWIRAYDLETRRFSDPRMLLEGTDIAINPRRFAGDQHYSPVVWAEGDGRLHVAFGFHRTPGFHLATARPADIGRWKQLPAISTSVSYPQIHRIAGGRTLAYFRDGGHLGFWTYRVSDDSGLTWRRPDRPVVDMDAPPHESPLASHAGSYHATRVSADGRTLHVAFVWKVEEPVKSERYGTVLHDYTRRHNLHYLRVDLASGKTFNADGREIPRPVNFATAQRDCLIWDTEGGSASAGASIALDEEGEPSFLLPVSDESPYASTFYFLRREGGRWTRTPLAATGHPFNSGRLARRPDGSFRAFLVAGEGESNDESEMNRYGWGDRIEEWASDAAGVNWRRVRALTAKSGLRHQNPKFAHGEGNRVLDGLLLYYAWEGTGSGQAFLVDERPAPRALPNRREARP